MIQAPDLSVKLGPLTLANPVVTAAGTFGAGREYAEYFDLKELGAIVPKTVTLKPRSGNSPPRIWETPAGMLNSIGLQNPGIDHFIAEDLPYLARIGIPVIVNIAGDSVGEYVKLCSILDNHDEVCAVELNISCPNVEKGGMAFGCTPGSTEEIVSATRKITSKPLIVKLSPNVLDIRNIAAAAKESGADIISLINTVSGMSIDIESRKPRLGNVTGGLSGPAIKPIALKMVFQVTRSVNLPIIGMGGISSAEDAIEFFLAGASAIAVGTANFSDPTACIKIKRGIKSYLTKHNCSSIKDIVGRVVAEG